jgi:hypothetical protein
MEVVVKEKERLGYKIFVKASRCSKQRAQYFFILRKVYDFQAFRMCGTQNARCM